jgi:retron-type reverse transcriptase
VIVNRLQRDPARRWTTLWHPIGDRDRLREAYDSLNREAAPGVEGQRWATYGEDLQAPLKDRYDRLQRGAYHALPLERVYLPKSEGRQRPLGKPTREDNLVQRATAEGLNALDEVDVLGFS